MSSNYTQTDNEKTLRKLKTKKKPALTAELLDQLAVLQGVKRRKVN